MGVYVNYGSARLLTPESPESSTDLIARFNIQTKNYSVRTPLVNKIVFIKERLINRFRR
jgi:hypothetical protein